jgi:N-glycosylase/DNA lyase
MSCHFQYKIHSVKVVPVDTHVRQIAAKHFGVRSALSSATPAVTAAIQQAFETRYGTYAGWAHAVR